MLLLTSLSWLGCLLCFMSGLESSHGLECFCNQYPYSFKGNDCQLRGNKCFSSITCVVQHALLDDGIIVKTHVCYNLSVRLSKDYCSRYDSKISRACCSDSDGCNEFLIPRMLEVEMATPSPANPTLEGKGSQNFLVIIIVSPIISLFIAITFLVCVPTSIFLLRKRKRRIEMHPVDLKMNSVDPVTVYTPYNLDTLDLLNQSCTSGSGSGEPILTQRTIAKNIKIGDQIGSGRFGQVFIGEYQGDEMAVKKFASYDEQSWFRETEIYNTVLLHHDNILGFFASDIFSNNGVTELWLITHYHPYGSLYDYLNQRMLNPTIMIRMAITLCRGLTHLHTEFSGGSLVKPAIAHRDIKSRNILVKRNRECCIADFGLAVIKNTSNNINFPINPKQGTKRYMAPEILSESIDMTNFESFLCVDIYAFGLVLWEMCKRCGDKNDVVGDYEAPFHGLVGQDPTFEEMKKIVVKDGQQPAIPSGWRRHDLFCGMHRIMKECWYLNSTARNSAIFYKMKLYQLAEEEKINFEHDDHE